MANVGIATMYLKWPRCYGFQYCQSLFDEIYITICGPITQNKLQCKHTKILENLSELKQLVFSEEWYFSYQENRQSTSAKTLFLLQIMRVSDVNRH